MSLSLIQIVGTVVGGLLGYVIGKYFSKKAMPVCPILCNPTISTIYFALLGFLLTSSKNI